MSICAALICSCASGPSLSGWTPVRSGSVRMPALDESDVLVIDLVPSMDYVKVGHFEPPKNQIVRVSFADTDLLNYFKKEAASMGANTVVLQNSSIRYKSGQNAGTKVDLLFVKDEAGTHGGDDFNSSGGIVPMNDELLQLY